MTIRTDLSINWEADPRIITVQAPSTEITMQDLLDTLRDEERKPANIDDDSIVDAAGKENLGGGVLVGLTVTLQNARVAFEARPGPAYVQCNVAGGNLVALDSGGSTMSAIEPTAFTQVVLANSSSATLQEQSALQYASFNGGVTVDFSSPWSGTVYPNGTPQQPVNNWADAYEIAVDRGFYNIFVVGAATLGSGDDFDNFTFTGESKTRTTLTIEDAASVQNCNFYDMFVQGYLDGNSTLIDCRVGDLDYVAGCIDRCVLNGSQISLLGNAIFLDSYSGNPADGTPTIDMGGSGHNLMLRNYNGKINLKNKSGSEEAEIDLNSGTVGLDNTVTGGTITVRGVGEVHVNGATATINTENLVNPATLSNAVVAETIDGNIALGSALQVILAALAGKAAGGGTTVLTFRNQGDTKNVLTMVVDEQGNRAQITLNTD